MVTLSTIQKESTWGAEATKINQNFTNVSLELTKLGMQSKASFGPYKSSSNLPSGASENATAWVSATLTPPFQVWQVQSGKWVNTGFTYTQDIGTGDLATKEDLAAQDEKLAELSSQIAGVGYVECTTAAGTAAKAVTVTGLTALTSGIRLLVKMTYNNTASNATLNINSLGAKPLYYNNVRVSGDNAWESGEVVDVYFDGTNFYAVNVQGGSGEGGNLILEWNSDAATTRKQVKQSDRKSLLQISYKDAGGNPINEQYIGTTFTNTEWIKDSNWEKIASESQLSNLKNELTIGGNFIDGFYDTSVVGNSIGNIYTSSSYKCLAQEVKQGERYIIRTYGGISKGRAWALTNTEKIILSNAISGLNAMTEYAYVDVEEDGYLFVNCDLSKIGEEIPFVVKDKTLNSYIANLTALTKEIEDNSRILRSHFIKLTDLEHGYYNSITISRDERWRTIWIPIKDIIYEYHQEGNIGIRPYAIKFSIFGEIPQGRFYKINNGTFSKESTITSNTYIIQPGDEKIGIGFIVTPGGDYSLKMYNEEDLVYFNYEYILNPYSDINLTKNIYVIGASFTQGNPWVTYPMKFIKNINIVEKGISGGTAISFAKGTWSSVFTEEMIEECDLLVINFTHNTGNIDIEDMYDITDSYGALNWIIRKYKELCRAKKDNPQSSYYGTKIGRPCRIAITSNWHDGRTTYTKVYKKVAENWCLPILDWQNNNFFAKNGMIWIDGDNTDDKKWHESVYYASYTEDGSTTNYDIQTIDGIGYGYHPNKSETSAIQEFMGRRFVSLIKEIFGL